MAKTMLCYEYRELLKDYLESPEEIDLYNVSLLGKEFIQKGIGPEDIIEMHYKTIQKVLEETSLADGKEAILKSFRVLLEIMMSYGMGHASFINMKSHESSRE